LRAPLDHDVRLSILTPKIPMRSRCFGIRPRICSLAAVLELFPNVKLGIGPPIDTGFFYDFVRDEPFTPEISERIEKKMRELAAQDIRTSARLMPKPEASSSTGSGTRASNASWWRSARSSRCFVLHHR